MFSCVSRLFFLSTKYPNSTAMMKNVLAFLEFSFSTQTNSQSGEDVSQITRTWIVETPAVKIPASRSLSRRGKNEWKGSLSPFSHFCLVVTVLWYQGTVKTDIQLEKDHKLVCAGKNPIRIKCPPFFNVCLSFTKQVNYKVSSQAKSYALLLSLNNPTEAGKLLLQ